jgi:hypothetical protein
MTHGGFTRIEEQSLMRLLAHPVTHENLELWLQVAIGIGFLYSLQLPIAIAIPVPMPNGIDDCFIFGTDKIEVSLIVFISHIRRSPFTRLQIHDFLKCFLMNTVQLD